MLKMRNKYCSNCLCTQRFLDLGAVLVCERCTKRLQRLTPEEFAERCAQEPPPEPWHGVNWPADERPIRTAQSECVRQQTHPAPVRQAPKTQAPAKQPKSAQIYQPIIGPPLPPPMGPSASTQPQPPTPSRIITPSNPQTPPRPFRALWTP